LTQNQINELFLCGVMADVNECVGQTALDALNKGYIVNYIGNAVGSLSMKNINKAMDKLKKRGIKIIEEEKIVSKNLKEGS
jgi:nicotinamidase-related amidase